MTDVPLSALLEQIELSINKLGTVKGIKKTTKMYTNIKSDISDFNLKLNYYDKKLEELNIINYDRAIKENVCNDDEFTDAITELENIKESFVNGKIDIETMIAMYERSHMLISKCKNYLANKKMEIVNI